MAERAEETFRASVAYLIIRTSVELTLAKTLDIVYVTLVHVYECERM